MNRATARPHGLAGNWEWLQWAAQLPAKPVAIPANGGPALLYSGRAIFMGGSMTNTGGGSGSIRLFDGLDNTGVPVMRQGVAAGGNLNPVVGAGGVLLDVGLFLDVVTATAAGSVYLIPLMHYGLTGPGE